MTKVYVHEDTLTITFTLAEKIAGLVRDQHVPLTAISDVEVVPDGLAAVRGLRAPGFALPGRRKIGSWRSRRGTTLVAVRGRGPAVRMSLTGQRWAGLLVTTDMPAELATTLSDRAH